MGYRNFMNWGVDPLWMAAPTAGSGSGSGSGSKL
jgi:hypothetical protein